MHLGDSSVNATPKKLHRQHSHEYVSNSNHAIGSPEYVNTAADSTGSSEHANEVGDATCSPERVSTVKNYTPAENGAQKKLFNDCTLSDRCTQEAESSFENFTKEGVESQEIKSTENLSESIITSCEKVSGASTNLDEISCENFLRRTMSAPIDDSNPGTPVRRSCSLRSVPYNSLSLLDVKIRRCAKSQVFLLQPLRSEQLVMCSHYFYHCVLKM